MNTSGSSVSEAAAALELKFGNHDSSNNGGQKARPDKLPDLGITRAGTSLVVPVGVSFGDIIKILKAKSDEEETERCIQHPIHVSPFEGAIALVKALKAMFGFALETAYAGSDLSMDIGVNKTMKVRWGRYDLPDPINGFVETQTSRIGGREVFMLHAHVKGKHADTLSRLIAEIERFAREESPYRGQAFSLTLTDADGDDLHMPEIKFLDLPTAPITVILRPEIERDIDISIFGPIRNAARVRAMGTPLKRNVLMAGEYGTGKTLTATRTAQVARENGWTYIYLPKASDLAAAVEIAQQYEPCILFVEDIDRVVGLDRTAEVNDVLNSLDGIQNKNSEVMVVFTTNHPGKINAGMRRPGRIDAGINLLAPDGQTVARLLKFYAGSALAPDQDLAAVGQKLENTIPARVREVVERARLAKLSLGEADIVLTADDLEHAAGSIQRENAIFDNGAGNDASANESDIMHRLGTALIGSSRRVGSGQNGNHHHDEESRMAVN